MKTNLAMNREWPLAIGSVLLALLTVGAISYSVILVSSESDRWVRHSHEVLEEFQDLLSAMQNAESSYGGFAITGKESYFKTYALSVASAKQDETRIRSLTADNSEQQLRIPILEGLVAQKIQFAEMIMGLRREKGFEAATDAIRKGPGEQIMSEIQGVIRGMQIEELQLLALREGEASRRLGRTKIALIVATILGLLIVGVAAWSVQRDNYKRSLVDETLRRGEEKYRLLLDGLQDYAIFMLDATGAITSWNAGAERIKGYEASEVLGHNYSCFFTREDQERGKPEEILRMAAVRGRHEEQCMRVRKNGSRFLANVTCTALRDPAGNLRGFSEISRDLTESKESEAKYRGLLEAAPDAMVVVSQGGEIVLLNVQAEKQFGYRRDELVGQPVKNIIPEGFAERLVADALRSAEDAQAQQMGMGIELNGKRKNGSHFPIEIMLSPLESSEGILVTAAIRDITTRKKAEAHLLQKVEELNRSNEELGQFANIASHDLQEPLRMVASYTQLLSQRYKGKLDPKADEFISFAVDGASRMQRLILDLLAYSRAGAKGKDLIETSSEEALQKSLLNLSGAIEDSGALVTFDPLPSVLADETQLIQLFQNLIGNAIKYQASGVPRVHVSASENVEGKWVFSVKDNGLGIDSQYFEKIFGMFQRLHKREEFAGTGMGLAICKKIVERHGGSISVESQPREGSIFRFALTGSEGNT